MKQEQTVNTSDLALAAALLAIGIPFASTPFASFRTVKGGDQYVFLFAPESKCGNYSTAELINAWEDEAWHIKNPEHPFAYIKCGFSNRSGLLDKVKSAAPLVIVEKHGKLAILSAGASPEFQTAIFSRL